MSKWRAFCGARLLPTGQTAEWHTTWLGWRGEKGKHFFTMAHKLFADKVIRPGACKIA